MRPINNFRNYKISKSLGLATALILLFLIMSISLAYAYTLYRAKWRTHQTGLDYDHLSSGWKSVVYNSRTAWNNAGADMEIYYSTISQNDVDVDNFGSTRWAGRVLINEYWLGRWYFSQVDMEINTYHTSATYGSILPASSRYDGQSIATHELGHLVGLEHSFYPTTMYLSAEPGTTWMRSLHSDDIAGIKAIYGLK